MKESDAALRACQETIAELRVRLASAEARIAALRVGIEQIACLDERNSPAQRTAERLLMNDEQARAADNQK
jgi:hypothetical protein